MIIKFGLGETRFNIIFLYSKNTVQISNFNHLNHLILTMIEQNRTEQNGTEPNRTELN